MFQRILVPLDGSERAERAIPVAARIARITCGSIVFIRVVPLEKVVTTFGVEVNMEVEPGSVKKQLAEAAISIAKTAATYAEDLKDIALETDVATGDPAGTIFSAAALEHADLIVMCSHGTTGLKRLVFKSIARQAVRRSPVPILVLNEHGELPSLPDLASQLRILIPVDGSELAESVIIPAIFLAAVLSTSQEKEIHLLRVIDTPAADGGMKSLPAIPKAVQQEEQQKAEKYLADLVKRVQESLPILHEVTITTGTTISADIAGTIIKQAEQKGEHAGVENAEKAKQFHLIAMATHGRSGLQRLMMGSVTEQVLGNTVRPVLVVRPHHPEQMSELDYEIVVVEENEVAFSGE